MSPEARSTRDIGDSWSVLLYLHIPKTAGTAVTSVLDKRFPEAERYRVLGPDFHGRVDELGRLVGKEDSRIRHVSGHFSFGLHTLFAQPCTYFSVFRDPIDRTVSLYSYIRTTERHPRHEMVKRMSLEEFALSGMHPEIENCQTKMWSGRAESNFVDGSEPCSEADLQRAMTHLEGPEVLLGLFERLPESVFLLCRLMNWEFVPVRRRNVTRQRVPVAALTERERAAVVSVNEFDVRLYQFVEQRFQQQIQRCGVLDRMRLGWLRWRGGA